MTLPQLSDLFRRTAFRRTILGGWFALTAVAAGVAAAGFRIDNSVGVWFAATDPALRDYRSFLESSGGREWLLVALERNAAPAAALRADRDTLVARLLRLADVHRVLSTAGFPEQSELVRMFLRPRPESPHEALLVEITNDLDRQDGYRERLVSAVRSAAEVLPTVERARIAGPAVINGELNRAARRDMLLFFPLVAALVALCGFLVYRNVRDAAVMLSVSLGTVVLTQGVLIGSGYSLNMVTIMLPTVLIALSVADAVHVIHAFHASRGRGADGGAAAGQAVRAVAWPCAGTTLTTIAGFLAFSGSSVLPVFQLAVFASFGIAVAWVMTMTGAPALLAVLWRTRTRERPPAANWGRLLEPWSRFVERRRGWIVAAFAVAGVPLAGLASLRADTDYVKFFRADARVPRDYEALRRMGFPQNPLTVVVQVAPEAAGEIPLEDFVRHVENLPGVHSVLSPFVFAGAAEADPRGPAGDVRSRPGALLQLEVMMDYPSSRDLFAVLPRIQALADEMLAPAARVIPTGTSLLWARMDDGVIHTQKESLAIVCVVCLAILLALFRSPGLALLGLALSLYPVAMVLGLMGLWGIPVNLATVLIAGIAVGLAVDDTIHFVHAYQAARRRLEDPRGACQSALVGVGLRMIMTSVVLVGAFAIMGLSAFMPTAQFGLLSSLTIALALAADLALLPAVLSWSRGHAEAAPEAGRAGRAVRTADPEWARLT